MTPTQKAFPNLGDLVRVLDSATDRRTIQWKNTAEEDSFRADLGRGKVRVSKLSGPPHYRITLLESEGTILEEYEPSGEGEVIAASHLFKKARRQALDISSKIQSLYEEMQERAGES